MSVPSHPGAHNLVPATLAEVARMFPDALEWFDVACPRLANATDLVFHIRLWHGGTPHQPCQVVTAYSAAVTPAEIAQVAGWWQHTPSSTIYLAARWDPRVGVWVRCSDAFTWRPGQRAHERRAREIARKERQRAAMAATGYTTIWEWRQAGRPGLNASGELCPNE